MTSLGIGDAPFTPTNNLTIRLTGDDGSAVFTVTEITDHGSNFTTWTVYALDATSRTGALTVNSFDTIELLLPGVAEHIIYDATGARTDTTFSVITAGDAGVTASDYTVTTTVQGADGGGGTPVYPDTGGFAIENAGTFEARSTDSTNWATSAEGVTVFGMPGIEYSIGGSGSFTGGGRFRNNTGNTITVQGNMRLRFTASNFRGDSTATITPFFWNEESTFVQGTFTRPADPAGSVSGEIIINPTSAQSTQWVQGGFLDFIFFDNQGDRPYDVTIDSVRVRFQGTEEFAPTGGGPGINTGISETVNGLNLNQFYGVDDGEN